MKTKVKKKKGKFRALVSDGSVLPSTAAPSVSGAYLQLAQKGLLQRVSKLRAEYSSLTSELAEIEKSRHDCNEPNWLEEYWRRISSKGRDFSKALSSHTKALEQRKTKTLARLDRVLAKIQEIEVLAPAGTFITLAIPVGSQAFLHTGQSLRPGPNMRVPVKIRDETIRKYAHLSDREICRKLDAELIQSNSPPIGFPESWIEDYSVSTYVDAYDNPRCRNRVQKLISKAKKSV
jgi:hypothetical protein